MNSLTRTRSLCESLQQYLRHHKNCYICRQVSSEIICDACMLDTALPHFAVPGIDLLQSPSFSEQLLAPYYQHFYALGEYKGILKPLINSLKFGNKPLAAQVLANFFMQTVYQRIALFDEPPDAIVPVPLSFWRYLGRGYNQSRLLAQALSSLSNIPSIDSLKRVKHTKAQSSLDREARLTNTQNAFALTRNLDFKHIALVDDVVTTGATINSACETIVKHYPDIKISVWAMAITPAAASETDHSKQRRHIDSIRH